MGKRRRARREAERNRRKRSIRVQRASVARMDLPWNREPAITRRNELWHIAASDSPIFGHNRTPRNFPAISLRIYAPWTFRFHDFAERSRLWLTNDRQNKKEKKEKRDRAFDGIRITVAGKRIVNSPSDDFDSSYVINYLNGFALLFGFSNWYVCCFSRNIENIIDDHLEKETREKSKSPGIGEFDKFGDRFRCLKKYYPLSKLYFIEDEICASARWRSKNAESERNEIEFTAKRDYDSCIINWIVNPLNLVKFKPTRDRNVIRWIVINAKI